jgi:hypothetical protein
MAVAILYLSLQLRWRHGEYRHMVCSDLSNTEGNLVLVILLAGGGGGSQTSYPTLYIATNISSAMS